MGGLNQQKRNLRKAKFSLLNSVMEQIRRDAILELYRAGKGAKVISNLLKYPKTTVYDIIKRFRDKGETKRKAHKQRSDSKRTPKFLDNLKRSVKSNPSTSMAELARRRNISTSTISRAINIDLGYKSFRLRVRHLLTEAQKEARVSRCRGLLSSLRSSASGSIRFFSDEKLFNVDRTCNRQNTRWICQDPEDVPMVYRTKNPSSIMVLGVISSTGHVMPPHFFSVGLRINAEVYLSVLRDVVVPWMDKVARGNRYTFQQDGAPAHRAKVTQSWLLGAVPHFWPATL